MFIDPKSIIRYNYRVLFLVQCMEPLLTNGHPSTKATSEESRSQMNSLCTKQPLNKGHPYTTVKKNFPKDGRYYYIEGFHALYTCTFNFAVCLFIFREVCAVATLFIAHGIYIIIEKICVKAKNIT